MFNFFKKKKALNPLLIFELVNGEFLIDYKGNIYKKVSAKEGRKLIAELGWTPSQGLLAAYQSKPLSELFEGLEFNAVYFKSKAQMEAASIKSPPPNYDGADLEELYQISDGYIARTKNFKYYRLPHNLAQKLIADLQLELLSPYLLGVFASSSSLEITKQAIAGYMPRVL